MSQRITISAHIQEMKTYTPDRHYKVVLVIEPGGILTEDDNRGRGYPLYKAEHIFAMLTSTCVGTYEFPTKVAGCAGRIA